MEIVSTSTCVWPWLPPRYISTSRVSRWYTPLKSSPCRPMGQFTGQERMPSTFSSSSISANGSLPARSSLFTKVKIGMERMRQTLNSFTVCSSTPLAQSISITALSAATRVR